MPKLWKKSLRSSEEILGTKQILGISKYFWAFEKLIGELLGNLVVCLNFNKYNFKLLKEIILSEFGNILLDEKKNILPAIGTLSTNFPQNFHIL